MRALVSGLVGAGNQFVFGIIDWDKINEPDSHVRVVGRGARYTCENFVFDPLVLAAYCVRMQPPMGREFGIMEHEGWNQLASFDAARLQDIANNLLAKVASRYARASAADTRRCRYVGGIEIELPVWYLEMAGHDLWEILHMVLGPLKRHSTEAELKSAIIRTIFNEAPELIPAELLEIVREIQDYDLEPAIDRIR